MSTFSRLVDRKTVAVGLRPILLALAFCVSVQAQVFAAPVYVHSKAREQTDLGECGYRTFHICRDKCPKREAWNEHDQCVRACAHKYQCNHPG
jgi:hypothetical protein